MTELTDSVLCISRPIINWDTLKHFVDINPSLHTWYNEVVRASPSKISDGEILEFLTNVLKPSLRMHDIGAAWGFVFQKLERPSFVYGFIRGVLDCREGVGVATLGTNGAILLFAGVPAITNLIRVGTHKSVHDDIRPLFDELGRVAIDEIHTLSNHFQINNSGEWTTENVY